MNLLVISDLHLNPNSTERNKNFLEFLESARDQQDHILILGDLFDLWLGWNGLTMEFQKPILGRMIELAKSGLVMDYVEGNRDFGISQYQGRIFKTVEERIYRSKWGNSVIHAEHGDLINKLDRPYRMWRAFSKNRISYFLLKHLPSFATLSLALRLEKGLKQTNLRNKMNYPERNVEGFYRALLQEGVDVIIVGHFHMEKSIPVPFGNRTVLFYNLPGWEQGFRYLVIPPDKAAPYFRDWGTQHGNSATS
jgi:UDP-2,3-diacylglucosamine hydrolase